MVYPTLKYKKKINDYLRYNSTYLVSSIKRKWQNLFIVHRIHISFLPLMHIVSAFFLVYGSE